MEAAGVSKDGQSVQAAMEVGLGKNRKLELRRRKQKQPG